MSKKLRMEKVVLSDLDLQEKSSVSQNSTRTILQPQSGNVVKPKTSIIKFERVDPELESPDLDKMSEENVSDSVDQASNAVEISKNQQVDPVFAALEKEVNARRVMTQTPQEEIISPDKLVRDDKEANVSSEQNSRAFARKERHSEIADLENAINKDNFSMEAKGGRFIHQKEEDNRVLRNDDEAHMVARDEEGRFIEDSYHGEAQEPLLSKSEESEELKEIVKKLSSLSHVKQVIVEKKKSQETTKLKMKVGNKETGEVEDIDITALDHRGRPIGIEYKNRDDDDRQRQVENQTLLVDSEGNISTNPEQYKKPNITPRPKPKSKEEMASGFRQISEKYERKTSHEKAVYKKTPKGYKNEYFYKVKSHQELYQVGMSYYRDMANGNKSMAFITHDSHKHLKDSILAIASFIKYQEDLKILIVSLGLENGNYRNVVDECRKNGTIVGENDDAIPTIYEHAGLSFIDFKDIFSFRSKFDETGYGELIDYLVNSYDLVLWDVPRLDDLKLSKEEYFPIFIAFDKVSIVVKKQADKYEDIYEMKKFFNKYGIKIKGILFSPPNG